nr:disease resistance RPP13-like protein 4 isoform X5 [Oryza sativa Japonica Group]
MAQYVYILSSVPPFHFINLLGSEQDRRSCILIKARSTTRSALMAVVLEALASNLSNVLAKMARKEVGMLLGISDKIDSLRVRLDGLKEFLADAERRRITDLHVQGWVKELKDAMYDATDILELCQLKAMDQDSRRSNNPSLLSLRNPLNAHHIGSRIMALNQRLDGIKQRAEQFSFIKLDRYGDCSRTAQGHGLRRTTPELDRSGVVGNKIEQDTRRLVELLTREEEEASAASISSNVRVVAIVGVGGIGKTTLAQNIFNHQDIKEKFDKIIWLSINQEFSDPELVRTAITGAGGEHSGHQELSLLQPILREAISGKKIFLVMDDMWSVHAWNNSLRIPLVNSAAQGSWVLITTRDERVAREMKAIQPYHRVDILSRQDAWLLLKKQMASAR